MGANETFCAECGTPEYAAQHNQGYNQGYNEYPQEDNYPNKQNGHNGQVKPKLKSKKKKEEDNKHAGLRGFLGSIVSLAALAVMAAYYFMGDLLVSVDGLVCSPLVIDSNFSFKASAAANGSFSIMGNFEAFIEFFRSFALDNATGDLTFGAFWENITTNFPQLLSNLPAIIFQLAYFAAGVLLAVAVIIGIFRFLIGVFSKKEYDLMLPIKLALIGFLSIFLSLILLGNVPVMGADGVLVDNVSFLNYIGGLMICIYAGGIAIGFQILLNIALAGRRFFRPGAMMKWLTNLGLVGAALYMMCNIPTVMSIGGEMNTPLVWFATRIPAVLGGGVDMVQLVCCATMGIAQLTFVWQLASLVAGLGKRASRTFKFDGYEDKSYIKKSIAMMVATISYCALAYTVTGGIVESLMPFAVGGVVLFVCAVINRIVLNKDQV